MSKFIMTVGFDEMKKTSEELNLKGCTIYGFMDYAISSPYQDYPTHVYIIRYDEPPLKYDGEKAVNGAGVLYVSLPKEWAGKKVRVSLKEVREGDE